MSTDPIAESGCVCVCVWGGGGTSLQEANGWSRIFTTGLTIMGSHIFGFFGQVTVSKRTRMFVQSVKSKVFFIQFQGSVHFRATCLKD